MFIETSVNSHGPTDAVAIDGAATHHGPTDTMAHDGLTNLNTHVRNVASITVILHPFSSEGFCNKIINLKSSLLFRRPLEAVNGLILNTKSKLARSNGTCRI